MLSDSTDDANGPDLIAEIKRKYEDEINRQREEMKNQFEELKESQRKNEEEIASLRSRVKKSDHEDGNSNHILSRSAKISDDANDVEERIKIASATLGPPGLGIINIVRDDDEEEEDVKRFKNMVVNVGKFGDQITSELDSYGEGVDAFSDSDYEEDLTVAGEVLHDVDERNDRDPIKLKALVDAFRGVQTETLKSARHTYENCFFGRDAVDQLILAGHARNRAEAVRVGRLLESEYNLFEHISGEYDFQDDDLIYQFQDYWSDPDNDNEDSDSENSNNSASIVEHTAMLKKKSHNTKRHSLSNRDQPMYHSNSFVNKNSKIRSLPSNIKTPVENGISFRSQARRRSSGNDRKVKLYKNGAINGSEKYQQSLQNSALDKATLVANNHNIASSLTVPTIKIEKLVSAFREFVELKDRKYRLRTYKKCFLGSEAIDCLVACGCKSRTEAMRMGNILQREISLFKHVTEDHDLKDSYLFYKFTTDLEFSCSRADDDFDYSIDVLFNDFKTVEIKDRAFHLKTYKNCFVGREAVDLLVATGHAQSREDAVRIGCILGSDLNYFEHVARDHEFKDEYLFYKFVDDKARGSKFFNDSTGKIDEWADFIDPSSAEKGFKKRSGKHDPLQYQPSFTSPDFNVIPMKDVHVASSVWPMDEHNTMLLDRVHPLNWQDPSPHHSDFKRGDSSFDLIVIGAGAGGLVSATTASNAGARVALIEANLLGGDSLNTGSIPSKALLHSANLAYTARSNMAHLSESGIEINGGSSAVKVNFSKVMKRMRRIRAEISAKNSAEKFTKKQGVEVFFGRGSFNSDRTILVNGRILDFRKAVIATGGIPALVPMQGLEELYEQTKRGGARINPLVMTHETFFNMTIMPTRLAIIGPGVIGMELGQAMQRLGSNVTIFGRSGRVLSREDQDLSNLVRKQLENDGVSFRLHVMEYISIRTTGKVFKNGLPELSMRIKEAGNMQFVEREIKIDGLLFAVGRKPNVTGLGLNEAGINCDERTGLVVNNKLQTTNPRVYGVGDCCSKFKFTHVADFMGRMVVRNALFFGSAKMSDLLIPHATFTTPEISSVGLYEDDLDDKGIAYKVFEKSFSDNDRAICDSATTGMVRIRVDAKTDKILGASIVGAGAGNLISEVTLAMQSGTGLAKLASVIHPYPTTGETVRQTGDLYNKTRMTSSVRQILRGIIKVHRYK